MSPADGPTGHRPVRPGHSWAALAAGLFLAAATANPGPAAACASCGSGTGDPLILYPQETAKIYLGMARSMGRQFLTTEGSVGHSLGPAAQEALVLSVGLAITRRGFITLTVPGLRNSAGQAAATGFGDPSIAARWTALPEVSDAPWRPQVQAVVGVRPGFAASGLAGTARRADELDRFGEGSDEVRLGVDLWWASLPVKAGVASFLLTPLPVGLPGGDRTRAGATWRVVVTCGADLGRRARLLATLLRDDQADRQTAGRAVSRSGKTVYSLQTTLELYLGAWDTLRLSAGRGAIAWSHDATRDVTMGLAWMHAW